MDVPAAHILMVTEDCVLRVFPVGISLYQIQQLQVASSSHHTSSVWC